MKARHVAPALRIVLTFALLSSIWILLSDRLVGALFTDSTTLTWVSVGKGWAYVTVTSLLLYGFLHREFGRRAAIEDALRESEAHYRALFRDSPTAVWEEDFSKVKRLLDGIRTEGVVDVAGYLAQHPEFVRQCAAAIRVLATNGAVRRLYGAGSDEMLLANVAQIFNEDSYHAFALELANIADGKTVFDLEVPVSTLQGVPRVVVTHWAAAFGHETTLNCVYVAVEDITDRKRMEVALRESELRLRQQMDELDQVYTYAPVGLFALDRERRYLRINKRLAAINGRPAEEHIGRTIDEMVPIIAEPFREATLPVFERGEPALDIEMTTPIGNRDWEQRHWLCNYVPLRDPDGTMCGLVGTVQDITAQKRAEESVRALNADLEQRVRERTAQLESANQELEAFSYSVSHDLRAPLRAIDGFSQALQEDCANALPADGAYFLSRIRAASQRMAQLIDDMLSLSRVTRAEMTMTAVDLSALAVAVGEDLRGREPARDVAFCVEPGLVARGDSRLLRIVLENLLGNAWKFTSRQPRATIEVGKRLMPAGATAYFVRDDGAGFDPAHGSKLFAPFQRLHRESEFEGTGVGLATVQRIISRHDGRVWAESAVGRGASFFFTLGD